ncbi:hypothetical protein ACFYZH_10170 [Streptomyces abikoensis]|uniref:hypothetical protein n=1 Tax=Streptomyces abikoensis TaxID=97398 RepID=UPI0036826555
MTNQVSGIEVVQHAGAWTIRMWWPTGPITGGPQRVTVEAAKGASARDVARGISSTILRQIDTASATENAADLSTSDLPGTSDFERQGHALRALLAQEGVSAAYLALLASLYRDMANSGKRALIPDLAAFVDRSPVTVKGHLQQARREGYLTGTHGKTGGELTSKAREVLASIDLGTLSA